ncbi:PAS domain-containing sensor histidine kinase [Tepidimonas sediminis]|uniref:PAS domain-containing sensor histidine kinase n=1 Tax=Tepidimonas sediminis TaxID=2588941 RepID=UPI00163D43E0|nr:PAS domain S-box protein [Tepidimonas sediminis]
MLRIIDASTAVESAALNAADEILPRLIARTLPHLPDVYAWHDPQGTYRLVSPQITALLGWRPSELLGRNPYEFVHPDDEPAVRRRMHEPMLRGATVKSRLRLRHRDGHWVWIDFVGVPLYADGGGRTITGLLTMSRDVSAEVEAHGALEERSSHLALVQDLAGIAWFTLHLRTRQLTHNEVFVELTGHAFSRLRSLLALRWLVLRPDRPWLRRLIADLRRAQPGQPCRAQLRLQQPGGLQRWVRLSLAWRRAAPATTGTDALVLDGALIDIDELVRTREQTRRWVRHEEEARQRERLQIAAALHDEVGQILTGLRWQIEAAQRCLAQQAPACGVADPTPDWLRAIDEAHQRLRDLARRLRPTAAALGLAGAVEQVVQEYRERWLHGLAVHLRLEPDLPEPEPWRASLITGMLRECLNNVARHARAHRVEVTLRRGASGWLTLEVADDGVGLEPARAGGGRRLGLVSLQERARTLKGRLHLDTAPGRGTRIRLDAPLHPQDDEPIP